MADRNKRVRCTDWFFCIVLLLSTDAVIPLVRRELGSLGTAENGDPLLQVVWAGVYLIVCVLALADLRGVGKAVIANKGIWVLAGLAVISALWAESPGASMRRSIALIGSTFLGTYLGYRYTLNELFNLVVRMFALSAVLSVVTILLIPRLGIHSDLHAGAWRGIYLHKNILGRLMALASVLLIYRVLASRPWRQRCVGLILAVIMLGLTVLSDSKAALAVLAALVAVIPVPRLMRRWSSLTAAVLLLGVSALGGAGLWMVRGTDTVLDALGRDATLSGRTVLWEVLLEFVRHSPWIGYGYGAFWLGLEGPSAEVWRAVLWQPSHAHNGFLDVTIQLGLVGLSITIWAVGQSLVRAVKWLRIDTGCGGFLPVALLVFLLSLNMVETSLLVQNSLVWILFCAVAVSLQKSMNATKPEPNTTASVG